MKIKDIQFEEIFPEYVHSYGNVISIPIIDTDEINAAFDKERVENGKCPLFNEYPGFEMDESAWYEVRLTINRDDCTPVELEGWADNNEDEDETVYHIPIDNVAEVSVMLIEQLNHYGFVTDDLKEIDK